MVCNNIWEVYFSPSGTTKTVVERISSNLKGEKHAVDFLKKPLSGIKDFNDGELVIAGMPVFSGRLPAPCIGELKKLKGNQTPVIAVVVYGNREYEDALLELKNILEEQGFLVIAAAAFVAQHSIFNRVAAGRPDEDDFAKIDEFSENSAKSLEAMPFEVTHALSVKGNHLYREIESVPLKPTAGSSCDNCGACARICPVHAIDPEDLTQTDKSVCITCTACIAVCPKGARTIKGMMYNAAEKVFYVKNSTRKEPEWDVLT